MPTFVSTKAKRYTIKKRSRQRFKGYPEDTYFGYASLKDCINDTVKQYIAFYGKGLKKWRYE